MFRFCYLLLFVIVLSEFPAQILTADGSDANSVGSQILQPQRSMACPAPVSIPWELFPLPCGAHSDCRLMGRGFLCCGRQDRLLRCTKGIKVEPGAKNLISQNTVSISQVPIITTAKATTTRLTTTSTTTTTTTTPKPTTTTKRAISKTVVAKSKQKPSKAKQTNLIEKLVCPKDIPFQWFPVRCVRKNSECRKSLGQNFLCCNRVCVRGMQPPIKEQPHQPILGVIPRECPSTPFGELLFESQACETDADCWPRVCCPDGKKRYCRTAMPRLDLLPATKRFNSPLTNAASYLQCSAPPPKAIDLFPRPCTSSLDCFPNLCCQEGGQRFCRPARKSIVAFIAGRVGAGLGGLTNQVKRET